MLEFLHFLVDSVIDFAIFNQLLKGLTRQIIKLDFKSHLLAHLFVYFIILCSFFFRIFRELVPFSIVFPRDLLTHYDLLIPQYLIKIKICITD